MAESAGYRALITYTQRLSWFLGQALRLKFSVRAPVAIPEGLDFEAGAEWLRQRARELYEDSVPFA
jgi:hypothetical protein